MQYSLGKRMTAELLGTFLLTLVGCGTAIVSSCGTDNYAGYLITACAFGLVLMALAYAIGNVSGCHVNPAVSLAMLLRKDLNAKEFISYVGAQVIGGIAAGAVLMAIFGKESGLGSNALYNGNVMLSAIIEIILTCIFVFVILQVTKREDCGNVSGMVIGAALLLVHLFGIGLTGTSVNPARSLVAIFAGQEAISALPVFIIAPLIGACLAAALHKFFEKAK